MTDKSTAPGPLEAENAAFAAAAARLDAGKIGPHALWDAAVKFTRAALAHQPQGEAANGDLA